jgi:tetratricopeptide (TPR) repeat protein
MARQSPRSSAMGDRKRQLVYWNSANLLTFLLLPCLSSFAPSPQAMGRTLTPTRRPAQEATQQTDGAGHMQDVRLLEQGKRIKRELAGGQQHSYRVGLSSEQFLKLVVEQQGIDVVVQVLGPDGKQILEFDTENVIHGEESVLLVADAAGDYRLNVRTKQERAAAGGYEIRIEELRIATELDRALQEARKLNDESVKLRNAVKYDEALPLAKRMLEIRERLLGRDHRDVAAAANGLATIYYYKGEYGKAEPLFQRALAIREKALGPEHPDVATALNNLANLISDRGHYARAEQLYRRALAIREVAIVIFRSGML